MKHHTTLTLLLSSTLLVPHVLHAETSPLFQRDLLAPQTHLSLHYEIQNPGPKNTVQDILLRIVDTHRDAVTFARVSPPSARRRSRPPSVEPLTAQRDIHTSRIDLSFLKSIRRSWRRARYNIKGKAPHSPYLWTSRQFCEELKRFGQTSALGQHGQRTTFTTFRHHTHTLLSKHGPITLPTLQISTPNNTFVSILDDCSNPLVLEIKEPSGFHLKLHRVERPKNPLSRQPLP